MVKYPIQTSYTSIVDLLHGVTALEHPLCFLYLTPADVILLPLLKPTLKGSQFVAIKEVQDCVTAMLKVCAWKYFEDLNCVSNLCFY